jgi:hypothetical protein
MSATATQQTGWLPVREFFALDLRSLALMRIGLAVMVLVDWIDRLPDLQAHYSDAGIVPRDVVTGVLPISVHFFHGSVWFQAVLFGLALVFGVLLLVGWRTPLVCLASWFLLISVHARNPALMQGGDQLLRMLLFWGIFLPLGACYSVDAARSGGPPAERRVLSPASFAYIVQLCLVYFFASAWKWSPEWRSEGSAVFLALRVESFTTRFAYLLLDYPELLRYLTYATVWLETLGWALLFLPFNVGFQRVLAVSLFVLFHLGLALTMELGNFPWVCMVAWLAILPPSFWNRLRAGLGPAGKGLTVLYDPDRGWARSTTTWLRMTLLLWDANLAPAGDAGGLLVRLRKQGGWGVLDRSGQERYGADALAELVAASPLFSPLALLARSAPGRWVARLVGGRAGRSRAPARAPGPPAWTPPGGPVAQVVVLFCLVYIVLLNTRNFVSSRNQAFPETSAPTRDNQAILPNPAFPFAFVLGFDQGWGLFAPRPGMYVGWELAVGIRKDGTHVDLLSGDKIDDKSTDTRPRFQAGSYANGRWRKLMQNLSLINFNNGARAYPYLLPGFSRYLYREWNRTHEGNEQVKEVKIIWWKEETRPPGQTPPPPERIVLVTYQQDKDGKDHWDFWKPKP